MHNIAINHTDIKSFLEELSFQLKVIESLQEKLAEKIAPDFNSFLLFNPDEIRLSSIIAHLLNPSETHGQKLKFLHLFLETMLPKTVADKFINAWTQPQDVNVTTEFTTPSNRRIDILVKGNGMCLAIENKPWAGDQKNQIIDYLKAIQKYHQNCILIYLSGSNSQPSEDSISQQDLDDFQKKGILFVRGYCRDLLEWLKQCWNNSEPERVRIFIGDFIDYIKYQFCNSGENMLIMNTVVNLATQNVDNLKAAITIGQSYENLLEYLIRDFGKDFTKQLSSHFSALSYLDPLWIKSPLGYYTGVRFKKPNWPAGVFVAIEAQTNGRRDYIIGVQAPNNQASGATPPFVSGTDRDIIQNNLNQQIGPGKTTNWWPWYKSLGKYQNFEDINVIIEIYQKHNMIKDLLDELDKLVKVLDSIWPPSSTTSSASSTSSTTSSNASSNKAGPHHD